MRASSDEHLHEADPTALSTRLTVIVMTYNEAIHIERCLINASNVCDNLLVVDSFSTDGTPEIAKAFGARVIQHPWTTHADQLNWILDNAQIDSQWVMRLDADEIMDGVLLANLRAQLDTAPPEVGAFEVNRRIVFMGRVIRHGGVSPMWVTRVWRSGFARCESRRMDEHMVVQGRISRALGSITDDNRHSLTWWTEKHNRYASQEAAELIIGEFYGRGPGQASPDAGLNRQAKAKRWVKSNVYARLPLGFRAWLFFTYRVVLRRGVLDGSEGFAFHTLQGLWYRLLVDYKVLEVQRRVSRGANWRDAVSELLGVEVADQEAPWTASR